MFLQRSVSIKHPNNLDTPNSPSFMHPLVSSPTAQDTSSPSTPTAANSEVMEDHVAPQPSSLLDVTSNNLDNDKTACIVCLVDLPETSSDFNAGERFDQIARLVPCDHAMHNSCLAPWVERANSCPICRQSFNKVKLSNTLSGSLNISKSTNRSCTNCF